MRAAEIDDLADGRGAEPGGDGTSDRVGDVGEAPALLAVAVDRERLAGEGLAEEVGHDRAVACSGRGAARTS